MSLTVAIWPVAHSGYAHEATSRAALLHELAHLLEDGGFVYRADVLVRVSEQPAAWGFSVRGCDGLLLLSVLPNTAQGWTHITPIISAPAFRTTYLYRGAAYQSVPVVLRLKHQLTQTLHQPQPAAAVIALAERGRCALTDRATQLIAARPNASARRRHGHQDGLYL